MPSVLKSVMKLNFLLTWREVQKWTKIMNSLCTSYTDFAESTDYSQMNKNANTTIPHTPIPTAELQLLHMPCWSKDLDIYEIRENLSYHLLCVMLSCAETSLNKAFQITQMTVIVGTDLWHTEHWHYPANIKILRLESWIITRAYFLWALWLVNLLLVTGWNLPSSAVSLLPLSTRGLFSHFKAMNHLIDQVLLKGTHPSPSWMIA